MGSKKTIIALILIFGLISAPAFGDTIIKTSGIKLSGKVVEQTSDKVKIRVSMGGSSMEMTIRTKDIHKITIDGNTQTLNERKKRKPSVRRTSRRTTRKTRTSTFRKSTKKGAATNSRGDIESAIKKAGTTKPTWWDSTALNYPSTLDLTWQRPPKGSPWSPQKWMGQYLWTYINENPRRWNEGIRTLHHTLLVNKSNTANLKQSMNALGTAYAELQNDWARAAFWWRKGGGGGHGYGNEVAMATCYWKLGNKKMAEQALSKVGSGTRGMDRVVKLWADLGHLKKALQLADQMARGRIADRMNFVAGNACHQAGQYKLALAYFKKIPDRGQKKRYWYDRAQATIKGIQVYEALDLKRVRDGSYTSSSLGYSSQVQVTITVKSGRITDAKVTQHGEKQYYSSLTDTPKQIVGKQGIKGVDAVTGATLTSVAILNATGQALVKGMN